MNKILLINIDSKIPNLALKKIEKYHLDQGDEVMWDMPLFAHLSDKIYVSCIFEKNKKQCETWETRAEIGGSGYDLNIKLPEEIENIKPRINMGFTSRGCIRNCKFCIVPQKEGKIKAVGDLLDLWDGKSKEVMLIDNNILALPDHFKLICKQARDNNIRLDFNQGLDFRLINEDNLKELIKTKTTDYRFAFDSIKYFPRVKKVVELLNKYDVRAMWYILVNFDSTFDEDMERINYINSNNQRAYVMRYNSDFTDRRYIALARWVNSPYWRNAMTFEDFCKRNKYYDLIK